MKYFALLAICGGLLFFFYKSTSKPEASPYFSHRDTKADKLPEFLIPTEQGGSGLPVANADGELNFDLGTHETRIFAFGFHESAAARTNVAHFDPLNFAPITQPISYDGKKWRYEDHVDDGEIPLDIDTGAGGKIVLLKDIEELRYQNRRLLRILLTNDRGTYVVGAWLVERRTKRLAATMSKAGEGLVSGPGLTKIDFMLRNWHSTEWDLYCDFKIFDPSKKSRAERASVPPVRVKFKLPTLDLFDISKGVENLFDVEIPYYKPKARLEKEGHAMFGKSDYYKEGEVPLRAVLDDVAQMVMYDLGEEVQKMELKGTPTMIFEAETPFSILDKCVQSAGYELLVDDEARTISVR